MGTWRVGDRAKCTLGGHPAYGKVGTVKRVRRLRGLRVTIEFDSFSGGRVEFVADEKNHVRNLTRR